MADLRENEPPPKEILSIMKWIVDNSERAEAGHFLWWPVNLPSEGDVFDTTEMVQVQSCVEEATAFGHCTSDARFQGGMAMLLKWLSLLPDPIVGQHVLEKAQAF